MLVLVLVSYYFIDLSPLHFHLRRDRLFGEFLSLRQSPLIAFDLAQYESPRFEPGEIVAPTCPNLTVLLRPVSGLVTTLVNRFSIMVQLGIHIQRQ